MNFDELQTEIERLGVHAVFGAPGAGWAIEQNAFELTVFLAQMERLGVQSVLEVGTGYRGGLSRFLAQVVGWDVTTVDIENYGHAHAGVHYIIAPGDKPAFDRSFDLVFIDAAHDYASARADWEHYQAYAGKVIALHDIAGLRECEGVALLWYELAYQGDEALHEGYYEVIADGETRGGIGWQTLT